MFPFKVKFLFFFNTLNIFIYLLCLAVLVLCCSTGFSLALASKGYSLVGAQASHCGGFSCCGAQALEREGFGSCVSQALEHRLNSNAQA